MTNEEYRKHEGISRSELFLIAKSPFHYKYAKGNPEEATAALIFGAAAHKYILEKDKFDDEFVIAPNVDRRTKAGKEEWAKFVADAGNREVISSDDFDKIKDMAEAIRQNDIAAKMIYADGAKYEQSFFWTDSQTGEAVKCRPDAMVEVGGNKLILDYKTTVSCADGQFERSVRKYGYKLQAGMYREGVFQNTLDDYGFVFIAQEKEAPYAVRVYICSPEFINEGYDQYRELLGIFHHCKETGVWYGYEGITGEPTDLVGEGEVHD